MAGTIIGNGLTIEGEITSDEEVIVAGTVRGKLTVEGPLTIDAGAQVEADIGAASLQVGGPALAPGYGVRTTATGMLTSGICSMDRRW